MQHALFRKQHLLHWLRSSWLDLLSPKQSQLISVTFYKQGCKISSQFEGGERVFGMENETTARGLVQPLKLFSFQYIVITLSPNNANIWFSLS